MTNQQHNNSNAQKTILHLIDTTGPGGAETVFIQLADRLRDKGLRSLVVIRGEGWVQQQLIKRGLEPIIIPAKGSFAFAFLRSLVLLIRREQVDLIQSHLLGSNVYAAIAGLITRTPVVATYHGMVDVNPDERFKFLKHAMMKFGIKRYVAVSRNLLENIRSRKLLDVNRASVIYNGVDLARFEGGKPRKLKQTLKLPDNAILVGCLGNVRPAKAYDNLIAAGAKLLPQYPELHFVIAGHKKPDLMAQLDEQITKLGVNQHFHFLGFVDDSADFLAQIDIFALPSSSEGFSIATIEAMAARLPIVVTRCGGPEEIVISEENALMVQPDDAAAFAHALIRLMEDEPLRKSIADAGYSHVNRTFGIEKMVSSYISEYDKLCQ